ncbi:acyclic terpene utilization AtuA family protein [Falsihalocynthiibacter sp. BN13B15]|uniref:acyclic terpene utilization AtuA family protein n=1 Tax=Falsihalocynthiibacter sp. BN13B15 TaxID=3240871 RepID=UPI003510A661
MVKVLIPSGALGLNYDKAALARGLAQNPDIIAIDGGSTDSGPAYLGQGVSKYARSSIKIEWKGLMVARQEANVPLVIGTAGTCGTDSAVNWLLDITKEIAAELGQTLKIAVLRSSQDAEILATAFDSGRVTPLPAAPEITRESFAECSNIVALAGAEQIAAAIQTGADVIIAGRTTDTATIAALPLMKNLHAGAAWHGAKIGECGALCATNPQSGVVMIEFDANGFTVTPMAEDSAANPHTVSAHMLYENSDPFILYEPGGHLDVTGAKYTALDARRVRVEGSEWVPSDTYTVKLEGAKVQGYQTVLMVLLRDKHYVENAQIWADDIHAKCSEKVQDRMGLHKEDYSIELRLIGQNASFGALETNTNPAPEIGILAIVTANTQAIAEEIGQMLNPYLLHHPLTREEEQPTFAFPFSPASLNRGAVYGFCLNHTLTLDNPMDAFSLEVIQHG